MDFLTKEFQLKDFTVELFNFRTNMDFAPPENGEYQNTLEINFDFLKNINQPHSFVVVLYILVNNAEDKFKNAPYRLIMTIRSLFEFDKSISDKDIQDLTIMSALPMTYSLARGIVAQMSGISQFNKFILPTVNFIEVVKQKMEMEKNKQPTVAVPAQ